MAENNNTGAIYGVSDILFNGAKMGLISEDGMQPGGDSPTKNRIYSAQKRNAPFAVILASPGSKMWSFTMIELVPENMVQVMGGKVETDGSYTPPTEEETPGDNPEGTPETEQPEQNQSTPVDNPTA